MSVRSRHTTENRILGPAVIHRLKLTNHVRTADQQRAAAGRTDRDLRMRTDTIRGTSESGTTTQRFEDIAADQWIQIVEGDGQWEKLPIR